MSIFQIAVDGPAGSGKSTVAKGVADKLGIMYLDTGAMYRTCGLAAIRNEISPKAEAQVENLMNTIDIEVGFEDGVQHMFLDGEDVTELIRTPEVSVAASDISTHMVVREKMVQMQREIAEHQSFILDGRDIASKVLPDAKYKFYVTASPETRAKRRLAELQERGDFTQNLQEVLSDIQFRDNQDKTRAISPLIQVPEAVVIDTGDLTIDETRDKLISYIEEVG